MGKGYGPVAIRSGLRERGVRGAIADLAIEEVDDDWQSLCEQSRKFGGKVPKTVRTRVFKPDSLRDVDFQKVKSGPS